MEKMSTEDDSTTVPLSPSTGRPISSQTSDGPGFRDPLPPPVKPKPKDLLKESGSAHISSPGMTETQAPPPLPKSAIYGDPALMSTTQQHKRLGESLPPASPQSPKPLSPATWLKALPEDVHQNDMAESAPSPVPEHSLPSAGPVPSLLLGMGSGSMSSLGPPLLPFRKQVAQDSMSYLESASMISGTQESLAGFGDDASSMGSDSEVNGMTFRKTDKYGFVGGAQFSEACERELNVQVARERERKWLEMFKNWNKWISRRFPKVKLRCRKGIPSSLRSLAWQLLSNSKDLMDQNRGKFEELERQPGDPKWLDIIEKDLHRQFPFHEMFSARGGHGQQDLYRILKAYTIYRPDEGYCQAQAPVAAVLLMHMPAEQAFWCLVQICEKYLPGYYSAGLEAIQLDGEIFFSLLRKVSPMAYRHLKKHKIDPILYMTEWFMCVFSRTLPWASVLRIWDMFFCEGVKIIFRVGLVLLRQVLGSVDKLRDCQGMYETMEKLRNIPPDYMREELLVHEVISLTVTESVIERERVVQEKKWLESRGEFQLKRSRRLHGAHAIFEERQRSGSLGGYPLRTSSSMLSLPGLRRSKEDHWKQKSEPYGSLRGISGTVSPSHSVSNLTVIPSAFSSSPPKVSQNPTPSPQVVSEGLRPSLPSPMANNAPLVGSLPADGVQNTTKKSKEERKKEKEREKQREKEEKEREKLEKEREKMEKERAKEEKEREKMEKEREKKLAKERAKEEAKEKKKQQERRPSAKKKDKEKDKEKEKMENGASSSSAPSSSALPTGAISKEDPEKGVRDTSTGVHPSAPEKAERAQAASSTVKEAYL
ncbi:TB10B protein, partial [Polypterus senegalus]|nr:TB10B protein [Polypterus senegalus]